MAPGDSVLNVAEGIPDFLIQSEEELLNHKLQASKALKLLNEQYDLFLSKCGNLLSLEKNYSTHPSEYSHYETLLKKLQRDCDADENRLFKHDQCCKCLETDLRLLREQNDKLQDEVLQFSEDIEKLTIEEEQLLKQRKEANESMALRWNSYIRAKSFYKKSLHCHIRIHDYENKENISNSDRDETLSFSYMMDDQPVLEIKLSRIGNSWKMLDAQPFKPAAAEAQAVLHKTNNIRQFVYCLWQEAQKLSIK